MPLRWSLQMLPSFAVSFILSTWHCWLCLIKSEILLILKNNLNKHVICTQCLNYVLTDPMSESSHHPGTISGNKLAGLHCFMKQLMALSLVRKLFSHWTKFYYRLPDALQPCWRVGIFSLLCLNWVFRSIHQLWFTSFHQGRTFISSGGSGHFVIWSSSP